MQHLHTQWTFFTTKQLPSQADGNNCGTIATMYAMYYALDMVPFSDESCEPVHRWTTLTGALTSAVLVSMRRWFRVMVVTNGNMVAGDSLDKKVVQRDRVTGVRYKAAARLDCVHLF